MGSIINCKGIAQRMQEELRLALHAADFAPGLAVILVGEDPASQIYVKNKINACRRVGIRSCVYHMAYTATTGELIVQINELASDRTVHGILVQLPLPAHIDTEAVVEAVPPCKDVDALTPVNMGRLMLGACDLAPCTPSGIVKILQETVGSVSGARCTIVGRSSIVGKPLSMMLTHANATVTLCHSHTKDLCAHTQCADILISSVGKAGFITADMVKKGAVVIDVGINRLENGRLAGDVCFEEVLQKADAVTPVPGGVGVMTVTALLENTCRAAMRQEHL